jgi:hypothetical protein
MSRRKSLAICHPCGRIKPGEDHLLAPTQIRRLFEAAADGLRDPIWASQLGRLFMAGKLTSADLAAAKRWVELVAAYSRACQSPRQPSTVLMDAAGGTPADPSSEVGIKEARRHEKDSANFVEGKDTLRRAGLNVEGVVESVCLKDCAPAGFDELHDLKRGLQALSDCWSSKRKVSTRG